LVFRPICGTYVMDANEPRTKPNSGKPASSRVGVPPKKIGHHRVKGGTRDFLRNCIYDPRGEGKVQIKLSFTTTFEQETDATVRFLRGRGGKTIFINQHISGLN